MSVVGKVESVWRYPVKSMRGEELQEAFVGFGGVFGDRWYAFCSSRSSKEFPYFTGREQGRMLLYRPFFRAGNITGSSANLSLAEALPPGINQFHSAVVDCILDVETPDGLKFAIKDPALIDDLRAGLQNEHELTLIGSDRAITDCQPLSLFSIQTVRQLAAELGVAIDKRRFRANLYLDLDSENGFAEDSFVGGKLRIGEKAIIAITERDPRCKMVTLDPDTAEANPAVIKQIAKLHDGKAGVYGSVLVEGTIKPGDPVQLCV